MRGIGMIEPELAFADLNDDMACATAYLQYEASEQLDKSAQLPSGTSSTAQTQLINARCYDKT
ncbi:hypothetical protein Taro_025536 [Colocasia esculenta]|uniref:Uncharacterized protein n=1 Tax=Colocasia esculenta TaxID=4460 RepID=A0A843VKT1_COLES|nr:hypothetical protein [Colocasia esculenta]